jgi:hypothetical protein
VPRNRILFPILVFLLGLGWIIAMAALPWIPEWFDFQIVSGIVGWLTALGAGIFLVRGLLLQTKGRWLLGWRITAASATGLLFGGLLYVGLLVVALSAYGGFWPPELVEKMEYPEYKTTLYIYNVGWMDAEYMIRVRHGFLPFYTEIKSDEGSHFQSLEFVQEDEWAVSGDLKIHLPTGEVAE